MWYLNKGVANLLILIISVLISVRAEAQDIITVSAVGDIMLGSDFPEPLLPPDNGSGLLEGVKEYLMGSDVVMGNLEGVLTDGGTTTKNIASGKSFAFRMPTQSVKTLKDAGFNFLSLANNHAGDFGKKGIDSTMRVLTEEGIHYSGPSEHIAYMDVKGLEIAIIAFAPYPQFFDLLDIPAAEKIIHRLKEENDIVIVSMHIGSEGVQALRTRNVMEYLYDEERGNPVAFAHTAVDAGADLVIGHGPHVPRAMELYKGRLIAYSLGNFCTYGYFNIKGESGLSQILKVEMGRDGSFLSGNIISLVQEGMGVPTLDPENKTAKLVKRLSIEDFQDNGLVFKESGKEAWINLEIREGLR